jgi:hypothetical protein
MTKIESQPEPTGPGRVVLDIGGDVGAAVVRTPAALAGSELEIRRPGETWTGRHVSVRERPLPDGAVWAGVFEGLQAGRWEVRVRDRPDSPSAVFTVNGGRVSNVYFLHGG